MKSSRGFTLIELLVVIAIIGILMALLFPAVSGALNAAKKAQAKNDVTQIATAIVAYETEYGKLPTTATSDVTLPVSDVLLNTLMATGSGTNAGNNPRAIVFLEVPNWKKGKGGLTNSEFRDAWGNTYTVVMDAGYDNSISVTAGNETSANSTAETLRKKVAVYNIASSSSTSKDKNYFRNVAKSW